jgi:hypothetical protein
MKLGKVPKKDKYIIINEKNEESNSELKEK